MIEREFNRLKSSDELWIAHRHNIGFDSYSRDEANEITNDDWPRRLILSRAVTAEEQDYVRVPLALLQTDRLAFAL